MQQQKWNRNFSRCYTIYVLRDTSGQNSEFDHSPILLILMTQNWTLLFHRWINLPLPPQLLHRSGAHTSCVCVCIVRLSITATLVVHDLIAPHCIVSYTQRWPIPFIFSHIKNRKFILHDRTTRKTLYILNRFEIFLFLTFIRSILSFIFPSSRMWKYEHIQNATWWCPPARILQYKFYGKPLAGNR